ncbi:hypothetical protein MOO44_00490 (plasmid) [Nicoliella spurrieriana]|uniref:Uncharacterized protein n=1 Tax=Nicoliella spurrieriana TaxID=2925830 RepID=A0A976RQZ5_9LACO|nr:hypothetical protein [Nicoliella spurrieriana]UQS86156.1 hypothetical protein MOO44_00490 [Nicoliella spurrieriana]
MSNDFLNKLAKQANSQLDNDDQHNSPFARQKETSKPIQVRESYYREIKKIAFLNDQKMVDVIDDMLRYAIDSGKFSEDEK